MKKVIFGFLAIVSALAFSACSKNDSNVAAVPNGGCGQSIPGQYCAAYNPGAYPNNPYMAQGCGGAYATPYMAQGYPGYQNYGYSNYGYQNQGCGGYGYGASGMWNPYSQPTYPNNFAYGCPYGYQPVYTGNMGWGSQSQYTCIVTSYFQGYASQGYQPYYPQYNNGSYNYGSYYGQQGYGQQYGQQAYYGTMQGCNATNPNSCGFAGQNMTCQASYGQNFGVCVVRTW